MFGSWRKELEHKLDLIYTALVVRDPGTSMAAEAFEGLRKQVIAGATARNAHVAQLAEFDVALRRGASADDLLKLTAQWLDQAGIVRADDPTHREAFESTVAPGVPVEVDIPAYVNIVTGQIVRQGRLRERTVSVAKPSLAAEEVPAVAAAESTEEVGVADEANDVETPAVEVAGGVAEEVTTATEPETTSPAEVHDVNEATEAK